MQSSSPTNDATAQSAIIWPARYLPGTTSNFTSNETITADLTSAQIWPLLADITQWQTYYPNCAQVIPPASGPVLQKDATFHFSTFGFPVLEARVREAVAPERGQPGRLAWSAALEGGEEEAVDVYHAWLVEDLSGGRVRVLTQESQVGKPAAELAARRPNVMLLGHQDWLDGLVTAARGGRVVREETNLAKTGLLAY